MRPHYNVAIIGAGVAGCSAAKALLERGVTDLVVLEASGRVGGRVHTVSSKGGYKLELGANWIHGDKGNALYDLCSSLSMLEFRNDYLYDFVRDMEDFKFYSARGERLDTNVVRDVYSLYEEVCDSITNEWKPEAVSIEDFKRQKLAVLHEQRGSSEVTRNLYEKLADVFDSMSSSAEALWPYDGSILIHADVFDPCGDKNFVFKNGVCALFEEVFLPVIGSYIKLNSEVTAIDWSTDPVSFSVANQDQRFTANHVIITCSLGYLKTQHSKLFTQSLPKAKIDALSLMHFGVVDKLHLVYDDPFWIKDLEENPNFFGYMFVFDESSVSDLQDEMAKILGSEEETWWRAITSLNIKSDNPHVLVSWLCGEPAVACQRFSDEEVTKVVLTLLSYFTGRQVHQSCKLIRTNWGEDLYARGSYSGIPLDYDPQHAREMLEPVYNGDKPVVLFAGEAYHPSFMSCLHGAFLTGQQQADVVYKQLQL